jgi:glycine cleavage system regulatory protein
MNIKETIKQLEQTLVELDKREALMIERIESSIRRTKAEINSVLIALDNLEKK